MKIPHSPLNPWIFDANEANFAERVIDGSHQADILVDFWADWCGPCTMLTPVLEDVVREYHGQVLLAKVEADENMKLCGHYKLRGFPTVLLFQRGELTSHFSGAKPRHWVRDFINQHIRRAD